MRLGINRIIKRSLLVSIIIYLLTGIVYLFSNDIASTYFIICILTIPFTLILWRYSKYIILSYILIAVIFIMSVSPYLIPIMILLIIIWMRRIDISIYIKLLFRKLYRNEDRIE